MTPTSHELTSAFDTSGEALSLMMVSLLERRYLTDMNERSWRLSIPGEDEGHILLRNVLEIGRIQEREEFQHAMPHILRACHEPGHSLVMLLHGAGKFQKVYLGGRRIPGQAKTSATGYISSLESAFKTYYGGLKIAPAFPLSEESNEALHSFIQTAPSTAVVTGIPSSRSGTKTLQLQSIDRLARATGNGNYVLMTVAEPVSPAEVDHTIDICRRLKSEIHSLIRLTISQGKSQSYTVGTSVETQDEWTGGFRLLGAVSNFLLIKMPAVAPVAFVFQAFNALDSALPRNSKQESNTLSSNSGESRELFNAHAAACDQLLDMYIQRLQSARSNGWWKTAVYVFAENETTLRNVTGALKSLCSGDSTTLDPIRVLDAPSYLIREAALKGQVLSMVPQDTTQLHPLGKSYDTLATCINSDELSTLIHLPINELPGLPFRRHADFALSVPPVTSDVPFIVIGTIHQGIDLPLGNLEIPLRTLNRHLFVTGMSGYGKTNTCMQILYESYQKYAIPFLVIEPAKKEYRNLTQINTIRSKVRVFGIGDRYSLPLRLNPFEIIPGVSIAKHIDLLKAVFNASFPMYAGMSYVLESAILEIYQERGWNIYTSENRYLVPGSTTSDRQALMPAMQDLLEKIDKVLTEKNYAQEIQQNLGAALRSRIESLMVGNKGLVLNSPRSLPFDDLMNGPAVVELQDLGDDDEKAFIMALFLVYLYEYAELRKGKPGQLQHITLIEEAHRLLSSKGNSSSGENGDPRAKAVTMFADMLAEMRAYGEGFIIADQVPTNLNPVTIKNTNLKIIHRLSAPDDRQLSGTSVNLTPTQIDYINNLNEGFAIVHDDRMGDAVFVKMFPFKDKFFQQVLQGDEWSYYLTAKVSDSSALYRHNGCVGCPAPCKMLIQVTDSKLDRLRQDFKEIMMDIKRFKDYSEVYSSWQAWYKRQPVTTLSGKITRNNLLFCAVVQQMNTWLYEKLIELSGGLEEEESSRSKLKQTRQTKKEKTFNPHLKLLQENLAGKLSWVFESWIFDKPEDICRERLLIAQASLDAIWDEFPAQES